MANILITGANRGIGLELCRQLQQRGETVVAACRKQSDGLAALGVKVIEDVDVGACASVDWMVDQLGEVKLDWLINNAGILSRSSLEAPDFVGMELQFRVNATGPVRVTSALRGHLGEGSKVGIITSRMGSIEDNTSGGSYGYRMSKAAVNIAGKSLSHDLAGEGVSVFLLHPGMVATEMTGNSGVSVEQSASGLIARMDQLGPQESGSFWHAEGYQLPW